MGSKIAKFFLLICGGLFMVLLLNSLIVRKLDIIGKDVYLVRDDYVREGYKVSPILDQTGSGNSLTLVVELDKRKTDFLDTLGYSMDVNLTPWRGIRKSVLRIEADMKGVILEYDYL